MKRWRSYLIVLVFMVFSILGTQTVLADQTGTCGDNVKWKLDDAGNLTISGTGEMYDYPDPANRPYGTSVKTVKIENGVTSIGDYAFKNCSSLTNITIPSNVTSIGKAAFYECSSLTSITIPSGVTSIKIHTFVGCRSLTSIKIPSNVSSIGDAAFANCSSLTSITIPSGVTSISKMTFADCSSLTSITIPSGVTSIGDAAFANCSSLTILTIPSSVNSIGAQAFGGCSSLTSITIPSGVTSIGDYAFVNCSSLTSITIPSDVNSIEKKAFWGCSSLTDVYYGGTNEQWNQIEFGVDVLNELDGVTIHFASNVSEISLNKTSISLNVGDKETLEATVKPANAKNNTIIWSSDNERVVTVNNDGVVTAVSPGTASITAAATNGTESTSDDKNATCTVTVNKLNSTITKAPEGKVLAYTGSAQELVTAGTTDDGTIYFALGTDDKTAPTMGYSTSIPTGIEAGTYYVWYKVFGDEKHNDTNPVCIAVTIGKTGTEKPTEPTPVNITRDAFTGVNETVRILANGTAVVKSVEDNGRNTLKVTGTVKQNGKTYAVSRFATNSFSDVDATTITIDLTASEDEQRVTFASRAFEESGAEKLKLRLTSASWVKFKSGAFSGSDIKKVLIYGLDQAGFKKIQKKMRAAGYKGKIVKK